MSSLNVAVTARDKDRRAAMDRLAARNDQVLDVIRTLGPAVEKVESGPASIWPRFKDAAAREHVSGYGNRHRRGLQRARRTGAPAGRR